MEIHINLRANKINKRGVFGDSPPVEITTGEWKWQELELETDATGRGSDRGFLPFIQAHTRQEQE
ncbi:GD22633 [Drosophila simulans]|uniref:GD22633 n=1 Tax=Drosophila simulans TaxID=7240 RepID=B4Q422_DROSI|nr:GD22633 [Drosophila simulans]